jgi:hypothetical protein
VTESDERAPSQTRGIIDGTLWDVSADVAARLRSQTVAALTTALANAKDDATILAILAELRAWREGRS